MLELKQEGLGIFLTWMVLGLVFSITFTMLLTRWCEVQFIFPFLLSLASSSSRSWSLFLDMGVRYSANSTLSCCTASSLEPCTLYIHMKGFSIFCSPWQVCISQIFFRCWLLSLSFSSFVFFVTFQLLCSNQKICLQFCPIKSPHHEMPRKSLRVMHYCKFLHMRQAVNLWVILQACF